MLVFLLALASRFDSCRLAGLSESKKHALVIDALSYWLVD